MEKECAHFDSDGSVNFGRRYRIEKELGRGGMGAVFAVFDLETGKKAAVKRLHRKHLKNEEIVRRFHREANLVASLRHPGICPVLYTGADRDGVPYFAMPLLKGRNLGSVIKETERIDITHMVSVIGSVLDALAYAHAHGVLHRDIKPDNVFICDESSGDQCVKILDFGISKISNGRLAREISTCTGAVFGTPHYMSPEQARGAKHIDNRADIFSVGIMLYEALTKQKPFDGRVYNDVIVKLVSEPFLPPTSINPSIPKAVEKVIIKAMARHPDDRYSSAEEMKDALDEAARSTGLEPADICFTVATTVHEVEGEVWVKRDSAQHAPWSRKRFCALSLVFLFLLGMVGFCLSMVFVETEEHTHMESTSNSVLDSHSKVDANETKTATRSVFSVSVAPCVAIDSSREKPSTQVKSRVLRHQKSKATPPFVPEPESEPITSKYESSPIIGRLGTKVVAHF